MLGYVTGAGRGESDRLLAEAATVLRAKGLHLAGVVQVNEEISPPRACHMDLHILTGSQIIRISQNLGSLAQGCRLDPTGLEQAVGLVAQAMEPPPSLLIINKFGKQEAEGRGFRPVIGQALAAGIPVLTAVSAGNQAAFDQFAEGLAQPLAPALPTILEFCYRHIKETQCP